MKDTNEIAKQAAALRATAKLSQRALAELSGCSRETVIRLEQGKEVGVHTAQRVLEVLGARLTVRASTPPTRPVERPHVLVLADFVAEFGLPRIRNKNSGEKRNG